MCLNKVKPVDGSVCLNREREKKRKAEKFQGSPREKMTLKLIDRELKSKYAEALYKNEASYDKLIDRKLNKLNQEHERSYQVFESGSMFFLNQVKQKRAKWTQDDIRFRDQYRHVCRRVHNIKLDNLKKSVENLSPGEQMDPLKRRQFDILQQQLTQREMRLTFHDSFGPPGSLKDEIIYSSKNSLLSLADGEGRTMSMLTDGGRKTSQLGFDRAGGGGGGLGPRKMSMSTAALNTSVVSNSEVLFTESSTLGSVSQVPELPPLVANFNSNNNNSNADRQHFVNQKARTTILKSGSIYNQYSPEDKEFLDKFPAKVELTLTDVGRQYIHNEKQKRVAMKRQKQRYRRIQNGALTDNRFVNLVDVLDS